MTYREEREKAIMEAYNAITGQDDDEWNPDKTLLALNKLFDEAEGLGFEIGRLDG